MVLHQVRTHLPFDSLEGRGVLGPLENQWCHNGT